MLKKAFYILWFVLVAGTVGIAIRFGLITETLYADPIGISFLIMAMGVISMTFAFHSAFLDGGSNSLRLVKDFANLQVYAGLYGTVIGLYLVFRGLGIEEGMSSADTTQIVISAVPAFLMAFWTSIVGMGGGLISILTYLVVGGGKGVE